MFNGNQLSVLENVFKNQSKVLVRVIENQSKVLVSLLKISLKSYFKLFSLFTCILPLQSTLGYERYNKHFIAAKKIFKLFLNFTCISISQSKLVSEKKYQHILNSISKKNNKNFIMVKALVSLGLSMFQLNVLEKSLRFYLYFISRKQASV